MTFVSGTGFSRHAHTEDEPEMLNVGVLFAKTSALVCGDATTLSLAKRWQLLWGKFNVAITAGNLCCKSDRSSVDEPAIKTLEPLR
jgi:hypothetical protein